MAYKAVGIDLGTTYSCVGVLAADGRVEIITNTHGSRTTPSCVAFTDDQILVGDAARNQLASNTANTVFAAKRMIGRRFADQCVQGDMKQCPFKIVSGNEGQVLVEVRDRGETKQYPPEYISSLVLICLKRTAEYYLGHVVVDAVITIPANFGDAQRQATLVAARMAGLNVLRIVNEPTAAALAYGFENINFIGGGEPRNVLVFDLGGGTLDVSILSIDKRKNEFEVKATAGNSHLGGDDFDNRMLASFRHEFKRKYNLDVSHDERAVRRLSVACERTKRALSSDETSTLEIDNLFGSYDFRSKIKRQQFELMCADLFESTIVPVEKALKHANLRKDEIDEIILVGGSSRIPKIQQLLKDYFDGHRLNKSINPDEAVAQGAAILAAKLSGDSMMPSNIRDIKVFDILSMSLGMKDCNGMFNVFIPRGTGMPCKITEHWCDAVGFKTKVRFNVYEAEDDAGVNTTLLGSFCIQDCPSKPAGQVKFDVFMEIDASGILHVSAEEKSTGRKNQISFTRRVAG